MTWWEESRLVKEKPLGIALAAIDKPDEWWKESKEEPSLNRYAVAGMGGFAPGIKRETAPYSEFSEKTKKAAKRGAKGVELDFLWHKVMTGQVEESEALKAEKAFRELNRLDPVAGRNWAENLWLKTAQIVPPMAKGYYQGMKYGTAGAGAAAVAGQLGPQALAPEEIVTVPGAYAAGQTIGSLKYWSEQGAGSVYRQARKQGLNHKAASYAASMAGPLYGAVEFSQVGKIVPGLALIKRGMLKLAIGLAKNVATETAEEGIQKGITEGATTIAKFAEGKIKASDLPAEAKRIGKEALIEMKEAVGPMAILQVPGAAVSVGRQAAEVTPKPPEIAPEAPKPAEPAPSPPTEKVAPEPTEAAPEVAERKPVAKEPWEMTREEFQKTLTGVALAAREERTVPEGWFVHGRAGGQTLQTGRMTFFTKDWATAEQYAGDEGSQWMVRPTQDAQVFDASNVDATESLAQEFIDAGKNEEFSEDTNKILKQATAADIASEINVSDIVDDAGWLDDGDFVSWITETKGFDAILTDEGGVIFDNDKIEGVRVPDVPFTMEDEGIAFQRNQIEQALKQGKIVPPEVIAEFPEVVEKKPEVAEPTGGLAWQTAVRQALKKSKRKHRVVVSEQKKARRERVGAAAGTLKTMMKKGVPARKGIPKSTAKLKGALTEYQLYEGIEQFLPAQTLENGFKDIAISKDLRYFEKVNTATAFEKLISGTVLTPGDVKLINKWRPELTPEAKKRVPWTSKAWRTFVTMANIPRTMLTMMGDVSGIGRQARALGMSDLLQYGKMIHLTHRSFISEKYTKKLTDEYESSEYYDEAKDMGVDFSVLGEAAEELTELEERYIGAPLLERVPIAGRIVRASERAFVAPVNWLRMMVYEGARIPNPNMSESQMRNLAQAINDLSGRSSIGRIKAVKTIAPLMSAFFSPRFTLSRMKLPYTVARPVFESLRKGQLKKDVKALATGEIRGAFQVVGRSMAMFIASNLALLLLAKWLWPDDTEIEPDLRSSDGGKLKIGKTRIDLWAGFLQPAQFFMRAITGQRKSQTGRLYDVDRTDLVETFGRSKIAPLLGLAIDLWRGRTFFGGKVGAPPRGKVGEYLTKLGVPNKVQGISKETWNRIGPLVAQDFADAAWEEGIPMALGAGALSFYGFGVQTYDVWPTAKLQQARNEIAKDKYNKQWDNLTMRQQLLLKRNPTLKQAEIDSTQERRKLGPGDWTKYHLKPLEDSAKRMQKELPDKIRTELELLQMTPGGVKRRIARDFYLNDKRYKAYESLAVERIERNLSILLKRPSWKTGDYVTRLKLMQKYITAAKADARKLTLRKIERGEL